MTESERQPPTIPGYTLTTRLGAGGYGEVWLAHAPGGLTKAVKVIFGSFHDKRAENELRSLHRIKAVRHPFVLSLERIEVVDDRLAIVTELAESSLKDRFDECRRQGLAGIPRPELLSYLHDAAEALDFLSEKHSLQHLDVKPENLLLVAGHIKVADFGLVKELGHTQASLVGGLTPLYSSPEVFRGTPGPRSDQYSLAMVYQEMLTGIPPFAGTTAAELTLQHLQGDPNLLPLPSHDRFILARALSKDPAQRFARSTEMVDALLATAGATDIGAPAAEKDERTFDGFEAALPERRVERRPGPMTQFFGESSAPPEAGGSKSIVLDDLNAPSPPRKAPVGLLSTAPFDAQPTVVIGVGGVAGRVLRQFRSRLARELGDEQPSAVQLLLMDSDPRAISEALHGSDRAALRPEETLSLPLRRPQDYREDSHQLMRWLSRRWLYNIPKSLRTEGLRPLGRLAFVDHAPQVLQKVRTQIEKARVGASDAAGALRFRPDALRVYVVASVAGGTGSGMSLDVGYAVRTAVDKLGVDNVQVVGLFLHSTGRDPRHTDLAKVNSFAWLNEYNHYHREAGVYPGDESCGLPALPAAKKAFDAAYFIDLGSALDEDGWDDATASIADYLYLDALTAAQRFFNACRLEGLPGEHAPLRSFSLTTTTVAGESSIRAAALTIGRSVLQGWLGMEAGAGKPTPLASEQTSRRTTLSAAEPSPWDLEGLAGRTRTLIQEKLGGEPDACLDGLVASLSTPDRRSLLDWVRGADAPFATTEEQPDPNVLRERLAALVEPLATELAAALSQRILRQIDRPGERLPGAVGELELLRQQLQQLEDEATKLSAGIGQQAAVTVAQIERLHRERRPATESPRDRELGVAYFRLRIDQHALLGVAMIARCLTSELRSVGDRLGEFARQVKNLLQQLPTARSSQSDENFLAALDRQLPQLAGEADEELAQSLAAAGGGLLSTVMGSPRMREHLVNDLVRIATHGAERLAGQAELATALAGPNDENARGEAGRPPLACLQYGGAYALLETRPSVGVGAPFTATTAPDGAARLTGVGSGASRCCEAWDLDLPLVAMQLIERRRDCAEFAERVSSRCDVDWAPLLPPAKRLDPPPMATLAPNIVDLTPVTMTQVL